MSIARMKVTRTFTLFILLQCRLETCGGNTGKITDLLIYLYFARHYVVIQTRNIIIKVMLSFEIDTLTLIQLNHPTESQSESAVKFSF